MALGNGSATANGGVNSEKAPVVNGTNMETLPRTGKQTDPNTAFLRAARAGQLDKLQEYLDSGTVRDINTSNANGLNALHLAAKDGHIEVVRDLLKRGAIVDAATKKGNTALHIASLAGQEEVVRLLIQHGASINVQSQNGFTPLYMAAQENHDGCVRYLLAKGANQALATEDGFTPLAVAMQQGHDKVVAVLLESDTRGKVRLPALHIAAKKDDVKAAALLLQNDHNPDVTSKSGFTPLHIAAHYGNDKVASLLYDKGADVNYSAKHNITPLHVASKWGKLNMVSLLVAKGAEIQAKTRDGLTPLHCAARSGHDQVVNMLIENGAPITSKTKNGLAPLHMAAQGEHVDAARILLHHGAPVDDVTVDYLTALHVAAHCGHVRVAKLLLDRQADANARALNGFTPLHIACKKNRMKMVELLLKHGASISATTESGLTPLHVASFMGCMNIVIYLLQHEASPDVPTVRGETPLHLAARANQTDIIRILLRNGAAVDARAREEQTPLHVASRLGNVDIVMLLLQHGAQPQATTKDLYTPLHIAAKEGQEEVASVLLDNGADLTSTTKKGFTPLHLAAKYGHLNVARLLLQRDAPTDAQGKNGVTPLHVAAHYDHQPVALLLLDKGASPHAVAKNGHTPLHIAARKNQMDIATTLLEFGAQADAESKAGFTPLHLSAQEGHSDMSSLLIEHQANSNHAAKNGLTPLHLCAQEDRVPVAQLLLRSGADSNARTRAGYTPLHVACHHGHVTMVRLLIEQGAEVNPSTTAGYTPLHQAAQQGHVLVINLLLKNKADPNAVTNNGQTALGIANKLGYISVVESLKVVTETNIVTTITINIEEKYRVVAPEAMQETFMSDSEDEGGGIDEHTPVAYGRPAHAQHVYLPYYQGQMTYTREDPMMSDQQQYRYMTVDDMKSLGDDSRLDVTNDEKHEYRNSMAPSNISDVILSPAHAKDYYSSNSYSAPDNVDINRQPIHVGNEWHILERSLRQLGPVARKGCGLWRDSFLVSFLVDARGGAMRGCRHSGVRVIVPPRCAASPTRITCRYVKPERTPHPPPLMEGEALASRVLELGPVGAKFLGPVILEVPHFASLRGKQREIVVLRSDNGETWREHTLESNEEAIQDVLNHSFEGEDLNQIEDLHTSRITRILTNDFPHYFAVVSRVRQEIHAIGPDGGTVSSSAVPQVQAVFPASALTKKIRVGLQAQPVDPEQVAKLLGHGVAVSPVVTVEPRRRKFHKAITLSMPAPRAHSQGMINQYSGSAPTLRLLCSITGGQNRAVWEDVTGSTPLTFVKDCVAFTTTVSARFWLMDCRNVADAARMATDLYTQAAHVPFMAKFVVFAKRVSLSEARIRVFCMTDDKEDKTLEIQEHFTEIAKSRDIEVLEGKNIYMEFAGNLIPVLKSGEQPFLGFRAFKENRLAFTMRVRDLDEDTVGRIMFMADARVAKGEPAQTPLCTLNLVLPSNVIADLDRSDPDLLAIDKDLSYLRHGISKPDTIHKADIRLTDICNLLDDDWRKLAEELGVPPSDVKIITDEYPDNPPQQAMVMLRLWLRQHANKATGNTLEIALNKIGRADIVSKCICNVELVTDDMEKALAKVRLDQSGFDTLKDELGPSRDTSLRRDATIDKTFQSSTEELDSSQYDNKDKTEDHQSSDNEMKDLISDYLQKKNENKNIIDKENEPEVKPGLVNEDVLGQLTEQLNQLEAVPKRESNTPPPSPADFKSEPESYVAEVKLTNEIHTNEGSQVAETPVQEVICIKEIRKVNKLEDKEEDIREVKAEEEEIKQVKQNDIKEISEVKQEEIKEDKLKESKQNTTENLPLSAQGNLNHLKKNIGDTLSFLHQERNDFLPNDDPIMAVKNTDVFESNGIQGVVSSTPLKTNNRPVIKEKEVHFNEPGLDESVIIEEIIGESSPCEEEEHREEIFKEDKYLGKTIDDSCTLAVKRSEEAFSFLEHEEDKSLPPLINDVSFGLKEESDDLSSLESTTTSPSIGSNHVTFEDIIVEKTKSNIPKLKQKKSEMYLKDEKDVDLLLSADDERFDSLSPTESEILSRIPVAAAKNIKVKTIKKHSKDPLKDFVKLVNADGNRELIQPSVYERTIVTTTTSEPVVKTTTTVIEYPTNVTEVTTELTSEQTCNNMSPKSKIPVLVAETLKLSPSQESKRSLVDSDSDTDSRQSPPLRGILKKSSMRTLGSSSGSDIALHEAGGELSDDDTESDIYQSDQPMYTETVIEEIDPVTNAKIMRTVRTMTHSVTSPVNDDHLRQSMQQILDQFMSDERNHPQ